MTTPSTTQSSPEEARRRRSAGLDGILVVDKPAGPTSHDIVALVRRLAATRRVGHGGTLDPFATGVLVLFLGKATRLAEYHLKAPKRYRATVCFGASSATDDLEGELTPAEGPPPDRAAVEAALDQFRGPILQVPPTYSAVKVGGRRAYAVARRGGDPALEPRPVRIDLLELVDWDASDPARPIAVLDVLCSAGMYVRALARDLGRAVGSAAYLGALTRTGSGAFSLEMAHDLDAIRSAAAGGPEGLRDLLLPLDAGLEAMPPIPLTPAEVAAVARGQFVRPLARTSLPPGPRIGPVRLIGPDGLVAIAEWEGPRLVPHKVLVDPPAGPARSRT